MCTLVVAFYPGSQTPLVIGANRDENPTRPAEDWKYRGNTNQISGFRYCPLDIPTTGTWVGMNVKGLFCAITNWDLDANKAKKSGGRGKLVFDLLNFPNVEKATKWVPALDGKNYKPFNIIIGDHTSLCRISCDSNKIRIYFLNAGLHISTGIGFNTDCVRELFIREKLTSSFDNFSQPVNPSYLETILGSHNDGVGSEGSICVHDAEHNWETRSSCIISLLEDRWEMYRTNMQPCNPKSKYHFETVEIKR